MIRLAAFFTGCALAVTFAAGCGQNRGSPFSSGGAASGTTGPGNNSGIYLGGGSGGGGPGSGSGGISTGDLLIQPAAPVLNVTAGQQMPTVTFTASYMGAQTDAVWNIDRGELGTISPAGVFTPSGNFGGTANVTATHASLTGMTTVTVNLQATAQGDPAWSANPAAPGPGGYGGVGGNGPGGAPSPAQMAALGSSPTADPAVAWLYPYDQTVWPQGLLAPLLQWNSAGHTFDAAYLHVKEAHYEYKGYFAANKTPFQNLPIPQPVWDAMTHSGQGGAATVTLVLAEGSHAFGPYTETWTMASANLHGVIYYNSYGTALVKNSATDGLDAYGNQYGAGTLAIAPGAMAPAVAAGINSVNARGDGTGCRVCHTVSADGKSLVTQASTVSAGDYATTVFVNLANDATRGAGTPLQTVNLTFPALRKDGSQLLSGAGGMRNSDTSTRLYALPAGTLVPGVTGLPDGFQAALPAFSPDTKHVSFNFFAGQLMSGMGMLTGDNVSLAMLDFDGNLTFSNPRVLYKPPTGEVTYSSFLPDSSGIVFAVQLSGGPFGFTWNSNTGELWWVDVASGKAHRLDALNGYGPNGTPYLPALPAATNHTAAQDATLNYELTVNPIASGGYAWIVFTSRRLYGNVATIDPWQSDPRQYKWLDNVTTKKLWVAAVDLGATPGSDPSHPAFYLPAQELNAGNSRGFWSVDVCKADGQACMTGDQCCGGYCQQVDGGMVCTSLKPHCAALYDKCASDADCCGAAQGI
ncbi:MAG TPA: hypothetical protein VGX76_01395, partial [Pirellulales bacterium]|nr:hypothetical protein [Pirellulales bacterium]